MIILKGIRQGRIPVLIGLVCWLLAVPLSSAAARRELRGHQLPSDLTGHRVGSVPDGQVIDLVLGLALPDPAAVEQRLRETYDPASPWYRHFLTPDQFGKQFGPSESDYKKILDFAGRNGLEIVRSHRSRLLVSVRAPAAAVRRAFGVELGVYRRADKSEFFAPMGEPLVDAGLPLAHVSGLDSFGRPGGRSPRQGTSSGPLPARRRGAPGNGSGPACGGQNSYIGSDFRDIYLPCTALDGSGQTVALVEFDNYYDSDIATYAAEAGQAVPALSRATVDQGLPQAPSCNNFEVAMDIEMVMAMAPQASIMVYEGPYSGCWSSVPPLDVLAAIADDDLAETVSSSWYWYGYADTNVTAIFQQYALQGQTFVNISGDMGAFCPAGPHAQPFQPVNESALMTVVGGTTLYTTGIGSSGPPAVVGSYVGETTWNFSPGVVATLTPAVNAVSGGGSCGGPSPLAIPTYQVPFVGASNGASASYRNVPDVALTASNLLVTYDNGTWSGCSCGTSAAAPLWAGLVALVNQQAALLGQPPLGYLNPALYHLAQSPGTYAADFNDVNDGSNNSYWGDDPAHFQAVAGYDLCTGLGSPKCNLIIDLLTSPSPTDTPTRTVTPTITPTRTVTLTVTISPTPSVTPVATPVPTFSAGRLNQAQVFPNPVDDGHAALAFELDGYAGPLTLTLYGAGYTRVWHAVFEGPSAHGFFPGWNRQPLGLPPLPNGCYFLCVDVGGKKKIVKLFLAH